MNVDEFQKAFQNFFIIIFLYQFTVNEHYKQSIVQGELGLVAGLYIIICDSKPITIWL